MKELNLNLHLLNSEPPAFPAVACGFAMVGDPRLGKPLEHCQFSTVSLNYFEVLWGTTCIKLSCLTENSKMNYFLVRKGSVSTIPIPVSLSFWILLPSMDLGSPSCVYTPLNPQPKGQHKPFISSRERLIFSIRPVLDTEEEEKMT